MKIAPQLIKACKANDRVAQKQLYDQLLPYLASVCRRYLINLSDLNDALQESFIRLFKHMDSYDDKLASFHTWAVRITINAALNMNRQMYKMDTVEFKLHAHQPAEEPHVISQLREEEMFKFLKCMPQEFFEVFNLHVVDGFSHKEIAETLSIEEALSRKRLSRARLWISEQCDKGSIEITGIRHSI